MSDEPSVTLTRLAGSPRPKVVLVSHGWGGGVRRHVGELANALADRADVLLLEPAGRDVVHLWSSHDGDRFDAWFAYPGDRGTLAALLRGLGVAWMHYHHVDGLPRDVLELASDVGVPFDVTLHDAYPYCPRYHLDRGEGRYCGEPDDAGCNACLARRPAQWPLDIAGWRAAFDGWLAKASRIVAPSADTAERFRRHFPALRVDVHPHPEPGVDFAATAIRVGLLGKLTPDKGFDVAVACARDAEARGLPLAFRILGPTGAPLPPMHAGRISMTGGYDDVELPGLIAAESPDVWLFPAQWPETWSYTLSAALATGRPIVASSLGALRERLDGVARARIVAWDAPASAWNDALLAAVPGRSRPASAATTPPAWREYVDALAGERQAAARTGSSLPALRSRHCVPPPPAPALPLSTLVRAGALCGEREALNELVARAAQSDALLASQGHDRELAVARERIVEIESSTSWQVTAPLRHAMMHARIVRARASTVPTGRRGWSASARSSRVRCLAGRSRSGSRWRSRCRL